MSKSFSGPKIMDALQKLSKNLKGQSINELRLILALERAIARIDNHPKISGNIVFKGGFVLLKTMTTSRFTRDVDALALGLSRKKVPNLIEEALTLDLDDGFWFGDVKTEDLEDQGPYGGFRFTAAYQIGEIPPAGSSKIKKYSRINLDVGFGDPVEVIPKKQLMPSILSQSKPVSWSVYPYEYIFAEKLEALFSRASANSRSKDIYDMPLIFKKCLNKKNLLKAISRTFDNRKTQIPDSFFKTAKDYQLDMLRKAWSSVELLEDDKGFDSSWEDFLEVLHSLDSAKP
jgi:predicted nucleotidyltransferase component of viral defense system